MQVDYHEEHAVVNMPEKININNAEEFMQTLLELNEQGIRTVVLDFKNLVMIDSAGLGRILLFQQKIKSHDGELKIINITSDYIRKMFDIIKLNKVINIEGVGGKR